MVFSFLFCVSLRKDGTKVVIFAKPPNVLTVFNVKKNHFCHKANTFGNKLFPFRKEHAPRAARFYTFHTENRWKTFTPSQALQLTKYQTETVWRTPSHPQQALHILFPLEKQSVSHWETECVAKGNKVFPHGKLLWVLSFRICSLSTRARALSYRTWVLSNRSTKERNLEKIWGTSKTRFSFRFF